jgi:hypothetical protein
VTRRLLNLLTLLSVLLFVAVEVLWVRSHRRCEWFEIGTATRWRTVGSSSGFFYAAAWTNYPRIQRWGVHSSNKTGFVYRANSAVAEIPMDNGRGFMTLNRSVHRFGPFLYGTGTGGDDVVVVVPDWAPAALTLALPAAWCVRHWREYRSRMHGQCARCGYDLRATPDRCPECGLTPAGATA